MSEHRIVLTAAGSNEEAQQIAHALVERCLAACVNIVSPVQSVYRWNGKVESAQEWLLLIKTTSTTFPQVRNLIRELHSYDLPECIQLNIEDGSPTYLKWITESVERG